MNANGCTTVKIGQEVTYRGAWGSEPPKRVKVTYIELCQQEREKYGTPVDEANVEDIRRCCFDLDDGHWCYGYQIDEVHPMS